MMLTDDINKLTATASKIRKNILKAAYLAGSSSSHFGGALSSVDLLTTLYFSEMNLSKSNVTQQNRDRFILSKGHGCLSLYSTLVEKEIITFSDLEKFEKNESKLLGHPIMNRKIGIEFSNGSLGMGLSLGIGSALAVKKKGLNSRIFVMLGDGECNEGSVWESVMLGHSLNLDNLIVIVDRNKFQQTGLNDEILNLGDITKIFIGFGWNTYEIDGHDFNEIKKVFKIKSNKPKAIIANTTKGKGFSFSENNNDWHHKILTKEMYEIALKELND